MNNDLKSLTAKSGMISYNQSFLSLVNPTKSRLSDRSLSNQGKKPQGIPEREITNLMCFGKRKSQVAIKVSEFTNRRSLEPPQIPYNFSNTRPITTFGIRKSTTIIESGNEILRENVFQQPRPSVAVKSIVINLITNQNSVDITSSNKS